MRIRVLGCYGGSAPGKRLTSFLVDGHVAVDAGAVASALPVDEQALITHVFLSHSHIDHLADLPFLVDNVFDLIRRPIEVYGPRATIRCLKDHLFNDVLWPDFSRLSNEHTAVLSTAPLEPGDSVAVNALVITPFRMDHTVDCYGYMIQGPQSAVAICADTCSTAGLAAALPAANNLAAVVLEASFPASASKLARLSKHLSTDAFARETARIPGGAQILVTHRKPGHAALIAKEISALDSRRVAILEQDREYVF